MDQAHSSPCCASKDAITLPTKAAALTADEIEGLRQMHPPGRLAEPAEIARAVLIRASDAASFMTGSERVVDGGFTAR